MPIEVFNRFEHKYLIDSGTYRLMTRVMDAHMKLDACNTDGEPYTITNLYYDTADDYLIRKSLSSQFSLLFPVSHFLHLLVWIDFALTAARNGSSNIRRKKVLPY